jgi:hypothetical protein
MDYQFNGGGKITWKHVVGLVAFVVATLHQLHIGL